MWEYRELPESLRMPPCPVCSNRLAVRSIIATLYVCLDCPGPHLFRATWHAEAKNDKAERRCVRDSIKVSDMMRRTGGA